MKLGREPGQSTDIETLALYAHKKLHQLEIIRVASDAARCWQSPQISPRSPIAVGRLAPSASPRTQLALWDAAHALHDERRAPPPLSGRARTRGTSLRQLRHAQRRSPALPRAVWPEPGRAAHSLRGQVEVRAREIDLPVLHHEPLRQQQQVRRLRRDGLHSAQPARLSRPLALAQGHPAAAAGQPARARRALRPAAEQRRWR